jgi:hypothetical protein
MVVKESGALIKATCVRGVPEAEELEIKLMAQLVAKRAHERAKRRDLLPDSRPHPDTSHILSDVIIPKKLGAPTTLIDAKGPRREHPHGGLGNAIKIGGRSQKLLTGAAHDRTLFRQHGYFNVLCQGKQAAVFGQGNPGHPITFPKLVQKGLAPRQPIRNHSQFFHRQNISRTRGPDSSAPPKTRVKGLSVVVELQADEIRTIVGGREQGVWVFVVIDVWSRLWPSTVVGKRSYRNTLDLFRDLSNRMNLEVTPLITADRFKFYERVIGRVFGPGCVYGQVIKTRRNDRVVRVERRAVIGAGRLKQALRNSEDSVTLNTSFVERLNLTIRQGSSYLVDERSVRPGGSNISKIIWS